MAAANIESAASYRCYWLISWARPPILAEATIRCRVFLVSLPCHARKRVRDRRLPWLAHELTPSFIASKTLHDHANRRSKLDKGLQRGDHVSLCFARWPLPRQSCGQKRAGTLSNQARRDRYTNGSETRGADTAIIQANGPLYQHQLERNTCTLGAHTIGARHYR